MLSVSTPMDTSDGSRRTLTSQGAAVHVWFSSDPGPRSRPASAHPESVDAIRVGRRSCLKVDLCSGDGVLKLQILGLQEISSIAGQAGEIFKRLAA
jgi:hypothetical protein